MEMTRELQGFRPSITVGPGSAPGIEPYTFPLWWGFRTAVHPRCSSKPEPLVYRCGIEKDRFRLLLRIFCHGRPMIVGSPENQHPESTSPLQRLYRPIPFVVGGALLGLLVWDLPGLAIGVLAGAGMSFVIGPFLKQIRAGGIPREERLDLIRSVLEEHPDAVRSAFPARDDEERFRAVGKALETLARRAASVAPGPGSVWDAVNVQRAAAELMEEQPTDELREFYRVLALRIDMDWYGADLHRPVSYLPEMSAPVEEAQYEAVEYERWQSPDGRENHVVTAPGASGGRLVVRCSGQPPRVGLELWVDDDVPEGSTLVEWSFDGRETREAEWSVGLANALTLDDPSQARSFVSEAVDAEAVSITIHGAGGAPSQLSLSLHGLAEGVQRTPCFGS